jgi:AcrR family transcriptional regulator
MVKSESSSGVRLSREEWLRQALEVLACNGQAKLRVRELAGAIGVSTGSFYWHFKNRADFVEKLSDYWAEITTRNIAERIRSGPGSAKRRLLRLMEAIEENDWGRYEIPIRAWGAQEPVVARSVKAVDRLRVSVLQQLFEEMGFTGRELEMRVMTCAVFLSLERGFFKRPSKITRREHIKLRHGLFTRK